ncbi:MAG: alpha/beta fold hydrolase [Sneathiella sp.]
MTEGPASLHPTVPHRIGPRPLGLHLGLASATLGTALANLPLAREGHLPWIRDLREEGARVGSDLQAFDLADCLTEVGAKGQHLVSEMLAGITKYHAHPYQRNVQTPAAIWQKGAACLLDYGADLPADVPVAFIVPSLVNRGYILDLSEERSFVRALTAAGIRPFLIDWGDPGEQERDYGTEDYIVQVLVPALETVTEICGKSPVHLMGYCMGGTLTVAQALLQQEKLASLITLASPWNFHAGLSNAARMLLGSNNTWEPVLNACDELPVDLLQSFFAALDPNLCLRKFGLFNRMDMDGAKAAEFVALEDWLNDGVPLVKQVARDCFSGWYGENSPYLGKWQISGMQICPQNITIPTLVAVPKSDKIVPAGSALGLAEQVHHATVITPPSGHIGMVAGGRARDGLWAEIIEWIKA